MDSSPSTVRTRAPRSRKRPLWFDLHFWIGWVAAIPVALVCLTGAGLAVEQEIFQWEHPELFHLEATGTPLSLDQVLERYRSADPPLQVNHLEVPESPEHAYGAYATELGPEGNRPARVFLDQYTGELTWLSEDFSIGETLTAVHRRLASGRIGQQVVGISSILLAVTCLIGLVLWWPLRGRTFVRAWKRGQALDWHNALGLVAMAPLVLMAVTGVTFTYGAPVFRLLGGVGGQPSPSAPPAVEVPEGARRAPVDAVVARAESLLPGMRLTGIQPANRETSPLVLFFSGGAEDIQLRMDPYTGDEMARTTGAGTGVLGWYRTHFGRVHSFAPYNRFLRVVWGLLSLGGTVLVGTGLWVSVRRWRRARSPVT